MANPTAKNRVTRLASAAALVWLTQGAGGCSKNAAGGSHCESDEDCPQGQGCRIDLLDIDDAYCAAYCDDEVQCPVEKYCPSDDDDAERDCKEGDSHANGMGVCSLYSGHRGPSTCARGPDEEYVPGPAGGGGPSTAGSSGVAGSTPSGTGGGPSSAGSSSGGAPNSAGSSSGGSGGGTGAAGGPACLATVAPGALPLTTGFFPAAVIGNGGYAFPFSDEAGSSACVSSSALCTKGSTAANSELTSATIWGAGLGMNLNQAKDGGGLAMPYAVPGSGIRYTLSNLPAQEVRLAIDNLGIEYCALLTTASASMTWAQFNTKCWDGTGTPLAGAPTQATFIAFHTVANPVASSFDFCVTSIGFLP